MADMSMKWNFYITEYEYEVEPDANTGEILKYDVEYDD